MENVYGYKLPYGVLYLYGNSMKQCKPYIDDVIDSVEDICFYCSMHNLRILHTPNHSIGGFFEIFRVRRLAKKYSVYGSWKEIRQYINTTQ